MMEYQTMFGIVEKVENGKVYTNALYNINL